MPTGSRGAGQQGNPAAGSGFGVWGCGFCPVGMTTVLAFQKFSWEREDVLDTSTKKANALKLFFLSME